MIAKNRRTGRCRIRRGTCIYCCICILVQNRFLLFCQLIWYLNNQCDVMIASYCLVTKCRNTLALQFYLCIGLCTWLNLQFIRSINRCNCDLASQRCLCKCNRLRRVKIILLSLESRIPVNKHGYKQVSTFTAVDTRLALCTNTDTLTIVNTCRNSDLNLLLTLYITRACTVAALILDNLSGTATIRTYGYGSCHTEQ